MGILRGGVRPLPNRPTEAVSYSMFCCCTYLLLTSYIGTLPLPPSPVVS